MLYPHTHTHSHQDTKRVGHTPGLQLQLYARLASRLETRARKEEGDARARTCARDAGSKLKLDEHNENGEASRESSIQFSMNLCRILGGPPQALTHAQQLMGCAASSTPKAYEVSINVYKLVSGGGQSLFSQMASAAESEGLGIYHAGVVIGGKEYSFGRVEREAAVGPDGQMVVLNATKTGVYKHSPMALPAARFEGATLKETLDRGGVTLSPAELASIIGRLSREWRGVEYDMLRHNDNHFAAALCMALGVEGLPLYVNKAADTGAGMADAARGAMGSLLTAGLGMLGGMLQEADRRAQQPPRASGGGGAVAVGVPVATNATSVHPAAPEVA